MIGVIAGMLIAGYLVAALFFARFWVMSRDRLFALFSVPFLVLAIQRFALSMTRETMEDQTVFYLLRFLAFAVIAFAILDKNRR